MTAYPRCFGLYESDDTTCVGEPDAIDEVGRSPCGVRAKCTALKLHCDDAGVDRGNFLRFETSSNDPGEIMAAIPLDEPALDRIIDAMLERKGIVETDDGVEEGSFEETEQLPDFVYVARPRKLPKFSSSRYKKVTKDLVNHFREFLIRQIPNANYNVPPRAILPGEIVEVDKSTTSKYLSYYFNGLGKGRTPLARIVLLWGMDYVDIMLPLTVDELADIIGQKTLKKLSPKDTDNGRYRSVCKKQRKEGLALAAEAIGWAIRKGTISVKLEEED